MTDGKIFQINLSKGGVPKLGQYEAEVTAFGLSGDGHIAISHGGPDAALCLYSLERILALQEEGHPIFPGSTGENLTLSGIDWDRVMPGMRMSLGDEVLIELTRYTTPCKTIRPSFHDQNSNRIRVDDHPGWSRVYARVLQPGRIHVGDAVKILKR